MRSFCSVLVFALCVSICLIGCSDVSAENSEYEIIVFEYNNELSNIVMKIDGEMYYSSENSEINNPWIGTDSFKEAPLKEIFEIPAGVVDERKYIGYIRTNDENKYFVELQPIPGNGTGMITLKRDMDDFPSLSILDIVTIYDIPEEIGDKASSNRRIIEEKEIVDIYCSFFLNGGDVIYEEINEGIYIDGIYFTSKSNEDIAIDIKIYHKYYLDDNGDYYVKYYIQTMYPGYLKEFPIELIEKGYIEKW